MTPKGNKRRSFIRWFLQFVKRDWHFSTRAITSILQRLASSIWSFIYLTRCQDTETRQDHDEQVKQEFLTTVVSDNSLPGILSYSYSTNPVQSEIIHLDEVAPSMYPFSPGGIRKSPGRPTSNIPSPLSNRDQQLPTDILSRHPSISRSSYRSPRRQRSRSLPDLHHTRSGKSPNNIGPTLLGNVLELTTSPKQQSPPRQFSVSTPEVPGLYFMERNSPWEGGGLMALESSLGTSPTPSRGLSLSERSSTCDTRHPTGGIVSRNSVRDGFAELPLFPAASLSSIIVDYETEYNDLKPMLPEETKRYSKRTKISKKTSSFVIEPLMTDFNQFGYLPGWITSVHPEGARYFYNPEKKVYTDSDLNNIKIRDRFRINLLKLKELRTRFQFDGVIFPADAVLVMDVDYQEDGNLESKYYYADHDKRVIFFLHRYPVSANETRGAKSYSHLGYEMQAQYWRFVSLYPDCLQLTHEMVLELRDIVMHHVGDTMTTPLSTAPYGLDDLMKILSVTREIEQSICAHQHSAGCIGVFARHMFIFYHSRFLNFHGESFARLERNLSVFGDKPNRRTWLIKFVSPLLFSAPDVHLREMRQLWVDGVIHKSAWEQKLASLNSNWNNYILLSTVMLTANVSFLAIQSVDMTTGPHRSLAQLFSYISTSLSFASISVGTLMQNRVKTQSVTDKIQNFRLFKSHFSMGLEILAVLFSLPYSLLLWGMVSFILAFSFVCFQNSNPLTIGAVASSYGITAILLVMCIYLFQESHSGENKDDSGPARGQTETVDSANGYGTTISSGQTSKRANFPGGWPARLPSVIP